MYFQERMPIMVLRSVVRAKVKPKLYLSSPKWMRHWMMGKCAKKMP